MLAVPTLTPGADPSRIGVIWDERMHELRRSTDRMFAVLMVLQWFAGIFATLVISPKTWIGTSQTVHLHVWAAVVLGGVLSALPIYLAFYRPGSVVTRHVIACSQMLWSSLLIHVTGGRIETHFHVFGSLAFLAFYRDWRVLMTATVVVATDHLLRGVWWPQTAFGIFISSPYRWLEHAGWVVFEDVFLVLSCVRGQREMRQIAERQAELEQEVAHRQAAEEGLERLNAELNERTREMEEFTYTVSHDLKSPIVTCKGFMEIIREDLAAGRSEELEGMTLRVQRALLRMEQSIHDLLDLSRIGRIRNDPQRIDVDGLLAELSTELAARLGERGVRLEIETGLPCIVADRARIVELFENLITNAIKYGCPRPGMSITVGGSTSGGEARFFVRDQGPGIAKEFHGKVFGIFQRLDTDQEGSGVGLAIVERIARLHGGRVWIESKPGEGACFWLAFPGAPSVEADREAAGQAPAVMKVA